jgi:hypothetical protein
MRTNVGEKSKVFGNRKHGAERCDCENVNGGDARIRIAEVKLLLQKRLGWKEAAPNEVTAWGPFWKTGYLNWLHFAGKYTSYAFMGYMEGALSSGFRLAHRLAVRDKLLP